MADLYLEKEELLYCDMNKGKIKVDKAIFDDYIYGTYLSIQFTDTDDDEIYECVAVSEDDEGIYFDVMA